MNKHGDISTIILTKCAAWIYFEYANTFDIILWQYWNPCLYSNPKYKGGVMEMINFILVDMTITTSGTSILKLTNTWGDDRRITKLRINDWKYLACNRFSRDLLRVVSCWIPEFLCISCRLLWGKLCCRLNINNKKRIKKMVHNKMHCIGLHKYLQTA